MSCTFCKSTVELRGCVWPAKRYVETAVKDLAVGDKVHRAHESERGMDRPPAVVERIDLDVSQSGWIYSAYLALKLPSGRKRERRWRADPDSWLLALRDGPCGALCCELHCVERGEVNV
jgi:hypothetical protein